MHQEARRTLVSASGGKELRPVWRTRAEIESHQEAREDLGRYVTRGREVR